MSNRIFLGEPPPHIKQWIIEHALPAGHADTWVKYDGDTEWTPVSIKGSLAGSYDDDTVIGIPTTQIPNVTDVVAIEIGTDVTSIGNWAFWYCSKLTSVTIPDSVTSIGWEVFYNCTGLTNMTIPDSVTSIGLYAFQECSNLMNVTIGNKVESIGGYAFQECSNLMNVTIGNKVESIGEYAFSSCSSLTSMTFLGKTMEQVQNIEDENGNKQYPWGIADTSIIHAELDS